MSTWTVKLLIPDGKYNEQDMLLGAIRPPGNWSVDEIRWYCDTIDSTLLYPEVAIHKYDTGWYDGEASYRDDPGDTGYSMLAGRFLAGGVDTGHEGVVSKAYSGNYHFNSVRWGAVLIQADATTGVLSTKVGADPQDWLTSTTAIAQLPAPDTGKVAIGSQFGMGPWDANTDAALTGGGRISKRDDESNTTGMIDTWQNFASATLRTDPTFGTPYNEGNNVECAVVSLYFFEDDIDITGGYVELDFTNDVADAFVARGEGRAAAIVTRVAGPAYIDVSSIGRAHTEGLVVGDGAVTAGTRGEGRARVPVRDAKAGDGEARLDALTSEVLYAPDDFGTARDTKLDANMLGLSDVEEARASSLYLNQAGAANAENAAARETLLHLNQAGAANPENSAARVTFLSVLQVLRVKGAPPVGQQPPPPRILRPPGCTMYNVIRAGEEESGIDAGIGTYRRLSDDIFLYRRELLQRLRMSYFDAEDITITLNIPQGLP